jgi:hypothetical protein
MENLIKQWSQSLKLLRKGDSEGWPSHEYIRTARWDTKHKFEPTPTFGKPIWNKEQGKVLVNADFGMGDTIHFYRFLNLIPDKILRCDSDLACLFDIETCSHDSPIPLCDYVIHMMALPRIFGLTKFSGVPYLTPSPPLPNLIPVLKQMSFTKIGLCWSGSPGNPRDFLRSLPADCLSKLKREIPMFHLVKHLPCPEGFLDARGYMKDWNQTAHLLRCLDLVISVDTAVAHLAGAMGVPTWLLLPNNPDWRWGDVGDKTHWYDSVKIFRQKDSGWDSVLDEICGLLDNRFAVQ